MKHLYTLEKLQAALKAWSDGPKYVLIHSVDQYDALKIAHESGAQVMISSLDLTAKWFERFGSAAGSFFIISNRKDTQFAESIISSRPDLDIHFVVIV